MLIPDARNKFQYVSANGNQSWVFSLDNVAQCIEFNAQHGQSSRVSRHPKSLFRSRALSLGLTELRVTAPIVETSMRLYIVRSIFDRYIAGFG